MRGDNGTDRPLPTKEEVEAFYALEGNLKPLKRYSHAERVLRHIPIERYNNVVVTFGRNGTLSVTMNNNPPAWFPIVGAIFTAITIAFLMAFLVFDLGLSPQKKFVFDILVAFCAAASAAFLGGTAAASGHIPVFKESPIKFSAVGGIGTFIVVFLILYATTG